MLRFLSFILFAAAAAAPAQAEKFRDADLKKLTGEIRAGCVKPSEKYAWMTPEQQAGACSCMAKRMEASLKKTDFVSTRTPAAPDKKKYQDFQNAATQSCMQPAFKVQTAKKVMKECVSKADTVPVTKGMAAPRLKKVCGCVSERYARTWTLALVSKYPDAASTMDASRGLFAESIAACVKK